MFFLYFRKRKNWVTLHNRMYEFIGSGLSFIWSYDGVSSVIQSFGAHPLEIWFYDPYKITHSEKIFLCWGQFRPNQVRDVPINHRPQKFSIMLVLWRSERYACHSERVSVNGKHELLLPNRQRFGVQCIEYNVSQLWADRCMTKQNLVVIISAIRKDFSTTA